MLFCKHIYSRYRHDVSLLYFNKDTLFEFYSQILFTDDERVSIRSRRIAQIETCRIYNSSIVVGFPILCVTFKFKLFQYIIFLKVFNFYFNFCL